MTIVNLVKSKLPLSSIMQAAGFGFILQLINTNSRYEKMKSTIQSWETEKKAKATRRLQRTEVVFYFTRNSNKTMNSKY